MSDRAYMRQYMAERRALQRQYRDLAKQQCARCGSTKHLGFHHRDPSTKRANPGWLVGNTSLDRYLEELEKCDVLCASCHATHHAALRRA